MTDFVLVHGAWHGAWCWQRVLPSLWTTGHRAFAVSLSGVGERAHLLSAAITLETHIADVLGVIEAEELRDAVLVGHSYGGIVITGVADRLAGRTERRLSHLVYLDAVVLHPGESWSSSNSAETRAARREVIARAGSLPPPDPALFGLAGADRDWVARRQTPQPGAVYDAALHFDAARVATLPAPSSTAPRPRWQPLPTVASGYAASPAGGSSSSPPAMTRWSARPRRCCAPCSPRPEDSACDGA